MSITQVTEGIFRGPQPSTAADIAWIQRDCKTVIRLEVDKKEANELAPAVVIDQHITFWQIHIPWFGIPIPASRLEYLVELVRNVPKPVLVHCAEGRDRTGLLIAGYRVRHCDWTKESAMLEAIEFGFRSYINFGLLKTWEGFKP